MDRSWLVGHVVMLQVLGTHGLWLWLVQLVLFGRGVVVEIEIFVVVAFRIELVVAGLVDDGRRGSERQAFHLDWAALSRLVDCSELRRQASHGTAPRARRPAR
jgi:hypothetical protein